MVSRDRVRQVRDETRPLVGRQSLRDGLADGRCQWIVAAVKRVNADRLLKRFGLEIDVTLQMDYA